MPIRIFEGVLIDKKADFIQLPLNMLSPALKAKARLARLPVWKGRGNISVLGIEFFCASPMARPTNSSRAPRITTRPNRVNLPDAASVEYLCSAAISHGVIHIRRISTSISLTYVLILPVDAAYLATQRL
jgi:hypothetical protein